MLKLLKLILFFAIMAVIEVIQIVVLERPEQEEKPDPDAVVVTAYRDTPFPSVYDEKAKRFVTSYRYVWEYQGKKHSMTLCDYNGGRREHCISEFAGRPDFVPEIEVTVNRNTGKYYIPGEVGKRKKNDLLSMVVSLSLIWVIVTVILFFVIMKVIEIIQMAALKIQESIISTEKSGKEKRTTF